MIIGITGNSGTGKTEISKILANKINARVINADDVVKELEQKGNVYYKKIVDLFGEEILTDGKLNRKKIAEIIYNNSTMREELNNLTFTYVVNKIKKLIRKDENTIIDAPLLFESSLDKICEITIAVIADEKLKLERISNRDKINSDTAKARINIQAKDEYYISRADYIINNNGKIDEINLEEICTRVGKN